MANTKAKKPNTFVKITFICVFVVGMLIALYPFVADLYFELKQEDAVSEYDAMLQKHTKDELDKKCAEAQKYNNLASQTNYYDALNFGEVMCVLEIDKIGVKLPVYHGTSSTVLDFALGHIETSSLPVGGASSHCVITGHTGLTRAKIFDDLSRVEIGDKFRIKVLNRTLNYEVDQIKIVLPNQVDDLQTVRGKDYVTLVTCTPYGVNTHRLLVRGKRIADDPSEAVEPDNVVDLSEYTEEENRTVRNFIWIGAIVVLVVVLMLVIFKTDKKSSQKKADRENGNGKAE